MNTYTIQNTISGHNFGTYEASSEAEALEAMARDAGYASYAESLEAAPVADDEIVVTEVSAS